jgi:site-specific DNA recombinase
MVMRLNNINKSKYILAVYARVSTSQQDIDKQVEIGLELAAKLGFEKEEVMVIKDHGVSTLQLKLEDRLGMTELLRIMKNKEIDILIVFDRDRLARNMVEYLVIVEQAIEYGVNIIFSNNEAEPFTNKLDREADLALYAEMEGKKINQRTAAVRKYYPSAPFGYVKVGKRSDTQYVQNENDIEQVKTMFKEFENIKNKSDFIQFKKGWETQKGINCKKILSNPFYAGVIIHSSGVIEPLNHIKGIVRKETILENRQKINAWGYNKKRERPVDSYFNNLGVSVICGECKRTLKFTRKNNEICLSCNHGKNGQRNVSCTVSQLKQILQSHVQGMIECLDIELLKKLTHTKITEHMQQMRQQLRKLEHERVKAIKKMGRRNHSTTLADIIQSVQEFDSHINWLTQQMDQLELISGKLTEFVDILNSEFEQHFPEQLNEVTRMLVKQILVGKDYVDIQTRASECLNEVV